jgi:hypothetical protein
MTDNNQPKCKIVLFTANPDGTTSLSLDEEVREIEEKIRASEHRDTLNLISKWGVRPDDLLQTLNEHRPQIVQFSGHGSKHDEILLKDAQGNSKPVGKSALKALFATMKDNIRLVILNSCYSKPQAEAIVEVVDCVIGMNTAIGDLAAIIFVASFYRAIGFGRSVQEAFEQGKVALMIEGIPEEQTPELLFRDGINPAGVLLVNERPR